MTPEKKEELLFDLLIIKTNSGKLDDWKESFNNTSNTIEERLIINIIPYYILYHIPKSFNLLSLFSTLFKFQSLHLPPTINTCFLEHLTQYLDL